MTRAASQALEMPFLKNKPCSEQLQAVPQMEQNSSLSSRQVQGWAFISISRHKGAFYLNAVLHFTLISLSLSFSIPSLSR